MASVPCQTANAGQTAPAALSKRAFTIAGIVVTLYGLEELSPGAKDIACLWLLHGRLGNQQKMEPVATAVLEAWNRQAGRQQCGLIAAAIDQRNHGTRLIDPQANKAWNAGNSRHALDAFSMFQGTAADVSQLITYLPACVFPRDEHSIGSNFVMGKSLGGHAAWNLMLHDPRVTTAVSVIGCPDYVRLMSQRAQKWGRESSTGTDPPGKCFLGSQDFPKSLIEAANQFDPAALLMNKVAQTHGRDGSWTLSPVPKETQYQQLRARLNGKSMLNLSGGDDKLVPYESSEPFLRWLEDAIASSTESAEPSFQLVDKVFEGVAHELSPDMMEVATSFIIEKMTLQTAAKETRI